MLLLASYYFYASWQPDLLYLILFTTLTSYLCALGIEKAKSKAVKRLYLTVGLVVSLSVLIFFKYFNFISENISGALSFFGVRTESLALELILPVGISFYTFQTLSYVIDVYRGTLPAEKHFGYYALYVSYFPQLVAGPIERPENLLPQLKRKNPYTAENVTEGLKIMAVGYFKKIVVADQIAKFVDAVYNNAGGDEVLFNGFTVTVATVLFAFQIYCDFSGYTDIAIGVGRIMGIKLMQNFNMPYTAENIKDFWKRWHISLTSWFTDYLYIPLGGSRCKRWRHYLNIFIVFLVSGIWHGAAWTFIIWGAIHGVYQIIGHLIKTPKAKLLEGLGVKEDNVFVRIFNIGVTFILVCLAWVAFRANSLGDMAMLYDEIFTGWGGVDFGLSLEKMGLGLVPLLTTVLSVYVMHQLDVQINGGKEIDRSRLGLKPERALMHTAVCWCVCIGWIILLAQGTESSFIYFQF